MDRKTLIALAIASTFAVTTSVTYADDSGQEAPKPELISQSDKKPAEQPAELIAEGDEKPSEQAPELLADGDEKPSEQAPELLADGDEKPSQPAELVAV